jgi:ABC-type multidrug transport system fused ATPase/permease subunit
VFSSLSFSWLSNLIQRANSQNELNESDIFNCMYQDSAKSSVETYLSISKQSYSLFYSLVLFLCPILPIQMLLSGICVFLGFLSPFFTFWVVKAIGTSEKETVALNYLSLLLISSILHSCIYGYVQHLGVRGGNRLRAVLIHLLYSKSLKRLINTQMVKKDASIGKISNMMSADAESIRWFVNFVHWYTIEPLLNITIAMVGLYYVIGAASIGGILTMVILTPLGYFTGRHTNKLLQRLMCATDKRVNIINEMLQNIRIIKYFSWERFFRDKIDAARKEELSYLLQMRKSTMIFSNIGNSTSIILGLVTFGLHTFVLQRKLDVAIAFTTLNLMNNLSVSMRNLTAQMTVIIKAWVAFKRIKEFLEEPDLETLRLKQNNVFDLFLRSKYCGFKDSTHLYYGSSSSESTLTESGFALKKISAELPIGKLTAIVGPTGAGKTSLILSLLGGN